MSLIFVGRRRREGWSAGGSKGVGNRGRLEDEEHGAQPAPRSHGLLIQIMDGVRMVGCQHSECFSAVLFWRFVDVLSMCAFSKPELCIGLPGHGNCKT